MSGKYSAGGDKLSLSLLGPGFPTATSLFRQGLTSFRATRRGDVLGGIEGGEWSIRAGRIWSRGEHRLPVSGRVQEL